MVKNWKDMVGISLLGLNRLSSNESNRHLKIKSLYSKGHQDQIPKSSSLVDCQINCQTENNYPIGQKSEKLQSLFFKKITGQKPNVRKSLTALKGIICDIEIERAPSLLYWVNSENSFIKVKHTNKTENAFQI